jgi:hypothetical protein
MVGARGERSAVDGGVAGRNVASTAFPHWNVGVGGGLLGNGLHYLAGCMGTQSRGVFPEGFKNDFLGNQLPLSLVDVGSASVLVMSPVASFVSTTITLTNLTASGGGGSTGSTGINGGYIGPHHGLASGVVGSVSRIPAGARVETLLTMSSVSSAALASGGGDDAADDGASSGVAEDGVPTDAVTANSITGGGGGGGGYTEALMHWGDAMLALGNSGKQRSRSDAAPMLSHLGYSTTAFYFYDPIGSNDGSVANVSYADTIVAVDHYAQAAGIPVHHYQLDSWCVPPPTPLFLLK